VTIHFVECEQEDREFFAAELAGHDLRFHAELAEVPEDAEVLSVFINSSVDADFLAAHPRLRYVATRSGATDHLNLSVCRQREVRVSNVPEYADHTVAEHTFALLLAVTRRLREIMAQPQKQGRFSYQGARAMDLHGKTLGIVGLGHMGRRVAELAQAFYMRVIAYDPLEMPPERARAVGAEWVPFDRLLAESDVISLHVRLSPWTYHLFDRAAFAKCRPGVILINTSRGRLIETQALSEALESGQVGGAGLDVLEQEQVLRQPASSIISDQIVKKLQSDTPAQHAQPDGRLRHLQELMKSEGLLTRPNVVFTPHVAFNSVEAVERLNAGTLENLRAWLRGAPINLVQHD
jgi:D-lactate dehydrogenase